MRRFVLFCFLLCSMLCILRAQIVITGQTSICEGNATILSVGAASASSPGSCNSSVNMSNGTTTVTCGETICFYDSGGPNGSYSNSESYVRTFTSGTSDHVTITFLSAEGESCCDYITVYDGSSTSSTELHYGLLSTVNGNVSFTSTGNSLTVEFYSDGSVTYAGWSAIVSCGNSGGSSGSCSSSVNMSNGTTIVTCGESVCFYDSGGPNNSYGNSESYVRTFTSSTNTPLVLTFLSANGETCCDYISVYDGNSTSSTQLHYGLLGTVNGNVSFTSTGSSLTVEFTSDGSVTSDGWRAVVYCDESYAYNYLWSTGATTPTITVSPSTTSTYTVTVYGNGVSTQTASITINVVDCGNSGCPSVSPAELGTGNTNIVLDCDISSVTLCANAVATAATADDYTVTSIPYTPPFNFTDGTRIFTDAEDDTWGNVMNLPFAFCYYGNTYTQIVPGANSVATFNTSMAGNYCTWSYSVTLPNEYMFTNTIFACYRDIYPNYYSGDGIYEGVLGVYPCRSYVLSFNNIALFDCYSVRTFSSMIVLYEGTNIIDIYLRDAPTCSGWNSGNGVIGIQNASGTLAVVPPGRNTGSWTAHNEAWRFIPTGQPVYTVTWYEGTDITGPVVGTGDVITVTPTGTTDYTARLQYTACNGNTFDIVNTCHVTMNNVAPPVEVTASPDYLCANSPTTLTASATGAVSYQWSTGAATASCTAYPSTDPTTYTVTVGFNNGCTSTGSVTVHLDQIPPVYSGNVGPIASNVSNCVSTIPDLTGLVRPFCTDNFTATSDLVITQNPAAGSTIMGETTVTLTITDECGNSTTATVVVTVPDLPQLQLVELSDILCYGASTGYLSVAAEGGLAPYTYSWSAVSSSNPMNGYTGMSGSSLQADIYTITVTDANGCTVSQTYTIQYLTQPMVAGTLSSDQSICLGGTPSTLTVTGYSGGFESYFVWQQSSDGTTFTDIQGAGNGNSYSPSVLSENTCYRAVYTSDSCGEVYTNTICITINDPISNDVYGVVCQGYAYNGNGFSVPAAATGTPGEYVDSAHLSTSAGCDSIVYLHLTINPSTFGADEQTIVENDLPYTWNGVVFTAEGTQTVVLTDAYGCDSTVTMTLHVNPNVTASIDTIVCSNALPLLWHDVVFSAEGTQIVVYTSEVGADSTVSMTVYVIPPVYVTVTGSVCQNELYSGYGFTVSGAQTAVAGLFVDSMLVATAEGCDSIVYLNLTVMPHTFATVEQTIVENDLPYTWNGVVFTGEGTQTVVLTDANGCDSTVTMILRVAPNVFTSIDTTICSNDMPFQWYGVSFVSEGTQTVVYSTSLGADSTVTMTVYVIPPVYATVNDEVCQNSPYSGYGFNLPASVTANTGVYVDSLLLATAMGCDSVLYLHLTVLPNAVGADEQTIVENDLPYTWNGVVFIAGGTQTTVLTAANGCDSTVTMTLNVIPNVEVNIDTTVCANAFPLQWQGVEFTTGGTQTVVYLSALGSDSTVNVTVNVIPPVFVTVQDGICQNQPYSGYGFSLTAEETAEAGIVERSQLFFTALGCDSTVTLLLTVHPNYAHHFDVIACDSMVWNGQVYRQSGSYTQSFSSNSGCDSVVTKDVEVVNTALELVNHTPDFCMDFEAELEVITDLDHIRWSTGEENVNTIIATHPGAYVVTANTAQCEAFDRLVIPACAFNLYIPNAITPSLEDGNNDIFCLPEGLLSQIETFEIHIFDRWGRVVFKSTTPYFRWDGSEKGKRKVNNTYTYVIKLSVYGGGNYVYKGIVTVL